MGIALSAQPTADTRSCARRNQGRTPLSEIFRVYTHPGLTRTADGTPSSASAIARCKRCNGVGRARADERHRTHSWNAVAPDPSNIPTESSLTWARTHRLRGALWSKWHHWSRFYLMKSDSNRTNEPWLAHAGPHFTNVAITLAGAILPPERLWLQYKKSHSGFLLTKSVWLVGT